MKEAKHEAKHVRVGGQRWQASCGCGWQGDAKRNRRASEREHHRHLRHLK